MTLLCSLYLLTLAAGLSYGLIELFLQPDVTWPSLNLTFRCVVIGGLGGVLYCLRAVYLTVAVRKLTIKEWAVWYFLRPIVSAGCGSVAYLFASAGLLVLEANTDAGATLLGFYALSFIAGYNVDKFLEKLEEIAKSVWGIEKSRSAAIQETERRDP